MNMALNSFCTKECVKGIRDGKLQCHCGEDVGEFSWSWSKSERSSNTRISQNNKDILFHPLYSSGTAVVRGDIPFEPNKHYYWEIKMISNLYGTDVMVGVGTSKIELSDWKFRFCSMLGIDSQSWGYSYHGNIQHNKKPLGIAFSGLKGQILYPMLSSTAAQSAMRIICSVSEESTLQMQCLQLISKYPVLYEQYKEIPGLTRLYERRYFWIVPTNEENEKERLAKLEDDLMCPLNYKNFLKRNKKIRTVRWIPPDLTREFEDDSISSVSMLETSDEESIVHNENDESTLYDSDSLCSNSSTEEIYPSTSKQICDQSRNKIRRTDSFVSHTECVSRECGMFCTTSEIRTHTEINKNE
ncbi:hypothetical protein JTB14_016507 [Gonioctena quinquepunctata]|nr:hypothetical protein JTB14_016507 [Gonioctena quinquepunctata]